MEIERLFCPYCGGNLKLSEIEGQDGIVNCPCSEWPLLSNILILKKQEETEKAIDYIKNGRPKKAIFLFLMKESKSPLFAWVALHRINFFTTMGFWRYNFWKEYTRYRFSSPTFLSFIPLISIIKEKDGKILDFGCGVGHSLFFLSKYFNPQNIIGVDKQFSNLYLARKFFCKEAMFICVEESLPFPNNTFSIILSLDSFHFVPSKKRVSSDFLRILKEDGIIILSHLHNKAKENPIPGYPLFLEDYLKLFEGMSYRVIPDYKIKEAIFNEMVDIRENMEVKDTPSFSIIFTKETNIFKEYKIPNILLENLKNPIINPIYKIKEKKAGFIIKRRHLSKLYKKEYPEVEDYIKKETFIYKRDIKARKKELFLRLFLIDAPIGYVNKRDY